MKIDEACINHNVVRLIDEFEMWDLTSDSGLDENMRIMALGYIKGLTELAETLKEVLRT